MSQQKNKTKIIRKEFKKSIDPSSVIPSPEQNQSTQSTQTEGSQEGSNTNTSQTASNDTEKKQ